VHPPRADQLDPPLEACPLCRSAEISSFDRDYQDLMVFRCRRCHAKFMNPQPSDDYLSAYYASYFQPEVVQRGTFMQRRTLDKHLSMQLLARFVEPGRFFSLGAGDGLEMEIAREHGWTVAGYEFDRPRAEEISARVDAPVHSGDFYSLALADEPYDCVFVDQVLEHPKNPGEYLLAINRLLRSGGVVYIGCPNIMSLAHLLKMELGKLHLRKRRGRHYDMCHHLFFYSPRSLKRILENHFGFRVLLAQGQPTGGVKTSGIKPGMVDAIGATLRRRFPLLDSSFRLIAQKVQHLEAPRQEQAA